MNTMNKTGRLIGSAALVLALGLFDFSLKPKAIFQSDNHFAQMVDRISFTHDAHAVGTDILTGGDGQLPQHLRFMYFLINGAPNGYPTGMDGPEGGFLGMIRQITGPTALGGGLTEAGYSVCTDIPATGNYSMTDSEGTFKMYFETPLKTIPTGYTSAGSTFEKRVVVQFDGTTFFNIEFNCSNTVGWIRMNMGETSPTAGIQRNIEVYYDTTNSTNAKLELYMTYEPGVTSGQEYFIAKFQTTSSSTYKFWIVRAQNKTGNIHGFRAAVHGDTSTDNTNAFLLFESGSVVDTSSSYTDNDNIGSGGDLQCLDYTSPTSPVAGSSCSSLTLDTSAGAPINDPTGSYSISWTGDTSNGLKNIMTTIAEPVSP